MPGESHNLRLLLGGDVMLGRGIDQIRPIAVDPELHEPYVRDARDYVVLAERASGRIPAPVGPDYVWGEALADLARYAPDLRLINLETAVTSRGTPWPGKSIHYRMHPSNLDALAAFRVDACSLANNHVLDWSRAGLVDSLDALERARIPCAGAGMDGEAAALPAILTGGGDGPTVHVFGACLGDSGVPSDWEAAAGVSGVIRLDGPGSAQCRALCGRIGHAKVGGGIVAVSLHWGGNWGYAVPPEHRRLAHALIDAGADLVHGHSSHHPKGVERYRDRLILYGCGDLVNDYEGIGGYEDFRPDLVAAFLADLAADGRCTALTLLPYRLQRFALTRPRAGDCEWLAERLSAENPDAHLSFAACGREVRVLEAR